MPSLFFKGNLIPETPESRDKIKIKSRLSGVFAVEKQFGKLAVLCLIAALWSPVAICGEWRKQPSGTLAWLHSIYFLDARRGWIAGSNGTLLATIDGGATWKISAKPTDDNLRDVFFTDEKNGWLLAERDVTQLKSAIEARSYLLRTNDGGATWERAGIFPISKSASPQFTRLLLSEDRRLAWAIGEMGSLYRLENNQIWQKQTAPTRFLLRGGALFNEREAILIGAGGTILRTDDGGALWRAAKIFAAESTRFNSVFFATRSYGWAVGGGGKIFSSIDGGKIWRAQNSGTTADLFDVCFVTANEGWAAGDGGALLRTIDSGNNWTTEKIGISHRLERIVFINRARGFAVGFGGTILSYSDQNHNAPQIR